MSRPDLTDAEVRAAYRKELKGVARMPRLIGFSLVLLGALLVVMRAYGLFGYRVPSDRPDFVALGILALGWVFLVWAFIQRNAYHRRRMSES